MDTKIVIIQNTEYHFETVLSLYQILNNLGLKTKIYRCHNINDKFCQINFLSKYNIETISLEEIDNEMIGFVVSAYPNPRVNIQNAIPNNHDHIFLILNKLIHISHRFKNSSDYEGQINPNNTLCLSPLSAQIGIDNLHLTCMPIIPKSTFTDSCIKLTVQGHFELGSRNALLFRHIITLISKVSTMKKIRINVIGTNSHHIVSYLHNINIPNSEIFLYNGVNEETFYRIINEDTDWLLPLITPHLKNNTYAIERYSSNFNLAFAFKKPILCDIFFQNIYNIPGIYFNNSTIKESIANLINTDKKQYYCMINEFEHLIDTLNVHNQTILNQKINYVNKI